MKNKEIKICSKCIMDSSDSEITFDDKGVCNHCRHYEWRAKNELYEGDAAEERLDKMISKIKEEGKGKEYDCIIGISGGVDSTMVAYWAKKLGLRPLAVHVDNGWDTELSVSNIEKILKNLGIDLYTCVINWEEFKDLQLSFLKASVANCEIPTDHAIKAVLYRTAALEKVRYIITGGNIVTEGILPDSWGYDPKDWKHIKAIHGKFGKKELKSYPHLPLAGLIYNTFVRRIKLVPILNYLSYNKNEAKKLAENELGWRDYGGKHYESIYTRFFQGYILLKKFGFDKRRAHFSTLINSGQMTRDEALKEIKKSPYADRNMEQEDKEYVIKKLDLSEKEFEEIMEVPVKSYRDYKNDSLFFNRENIFVKITKKIITHNY